MPVFNAPGMLITILGLSAGVAVFLSGFFSIKQKRLIENTPTSKIRSLAMGLVEVYGSVVHVKENLLKSPFSVKDCVYCKYLIEEYRRAGKSSTWVTVKSDEKMSQFYIKDDAGTVMVDPKGAKMEIPMDFEYRSGWGRDPPESIKQFLKKK